VEKGAQCGTNLFPTDFSLSLSLSLDRINKKTFPPLIPVPALSVDL